MKTFEIETFIEEVIEEGRDPRDTSYELLERLLQEQDAYDTMKEQGKGLKGLTKGQQVRYVRDAYRGLKDVMSNPEPSDEDRELAKLVLADLTAASESDEAAFAEVADMVIGTPAQVASFINSVSDFILKKPVKYKHKEYDKNREAVWHAKDSDIPVKVTGYYDDEKGNRWYTSEGTKTGIPGAELSFSKRKDPSTPKTKVRDLVRNLNRAMQDYKKDPDSEERAVALGIATNNLEQFRKTDPEKFETLSGDLETSFGSVVRLRKEALDLVTTTEPDTTQNYPQGAAKTKKDSDAYDWKKAKEDATVAAVGEALNLRANIALVMDDLKKAKTKEDFVKIKNSLKSHSDWYNSILTDPEHKGLLANLDDNGSRALADSKNLLRTFDKVVNDELARFGVEGGERGVELVDIDAAKKEQEAEGDSPIDKALEVEKQKAADRKKEQELKDAQKDDKTLHPDKQEKDSNTGKTAADKKKEAEDAQKEPVEQASKHDESGVKDKRKETGQDKMVKRAYDRASRMAGDFKDFITRFGLNVFRGEKSRLYAGVCAGLVVGVVIKYGISWVKNRHIRRVSVMATNKALMMADMEGLAVTPKALKKAFKQMTRSPMIQAKIKRYLQRAKSVGMQYQALDNVADYISKELIRYFKRMGVAKVPPRLGVPQPGDPPSARGYIHPPGFKDVVGFPHSGVGGRQDGTEFPGGI